MKTEQITAAGGVVYRDTSRGRKVLLIKRNGVWDLPKGKLEPGESIPGCAVREVEEETGLDGLSVVAFLCKTYHEYEREGQHFGKTTWWYSMKPNLEGDPTGTPQYEEGITELEWVNQEDAIKRVYFDNLREVLRTL